MVDLVVTQHADLFAHPVDVRQLDCPKVAVEARVALDGIFVPSCVSRRGAKERVDCGGHRWWAEEEAGELCHLQRLLLEECGECDARRVSWCVDESSLQPHELVELLLCVGRRTSGCGVLVEVRSP